jgi:hypothetical protein
MNENTSWNPWPRRANWRLAVASNLFIRITGVELMTGGDEG